jgi:phosphinothricin acetyltransferase
MPASQPKAEGIRNPHRQETVSMTPHIRKAVPEDAAAICRIYNHYVLKTVITFEEVEVTADEMARRIAEVTATFPWLVLEREGEFLGYAYASMWQPRSAYRHSVESTIYLSPTATGQGLGTALYKDLLERLRQRPIHTVIGCIALPNAGSVGLHEKCGFKKVSHFKQVGFKFGQWVDMGHWQLLL